MLAAVPVAVAQEDRHAVVGSWQDDRDGPRGQAGRGAAAQAVAEHDRVDPGSGRVDLLLDPLAEGPRLDVERRAQVDHVDDVRRRRREEVGRAEEDVAGDRQEMEALTGASDRRGRHQATLPARA